MPRKYKPRPYKRRLPKTFRQTFEPKSFVEFFDDGFELLAFAVVYAALSDLQRPRKRADAERFLQSAWFEKLAFDLELTPELWHKYARNAAKSNLVCTHGQITNANQHTISTETTRTGAG